MAPRKNETPAPVAQAPAAVPMTTLGGFAVSVLAFIPIDAKDLRKQAEIPMLLLDIQEGKKDISALAPYLKNVEFRQQHIRKRFTQQEADEMLRKAPDLTAEDLKGGDLEPGTLGGAEIEGEDGEEMPSEQDYADRDMES